MDTYNQIATREVAKALHEFKHEKKYTSRQQAIAAGLSQARQQAFGLTRHSNRS